MKKSLLTLFSELDFSTRNILADINSPRTLAFFALYLAKNKFGIVSLSVEHIVACLEMSGVAQNKKSIVRALANTGGCVSRKINDNDEAFYTLMTKGEREVEKVLNNDSRLTVLRIESGQPRQARLKLAELLKTMSGTIRVCDPFYGLKTLNSLELFSKSCDVRFLTQRTSEFGSPIKAALADFYYERPKTELKLAISSAPLHDRFIIADNQIIILGHGIKDIGNKESFVIVLDKKLVSNLIDEVVASFDKQWKLGTKII